METLWLYPSHGKPSTETREIIGADTLAQKRDEVCLRETALAQTRIALAWLIPEIDRLPVPATRQCPVGISTKTWWRTDAWLLNLVLDSCSPTSVPLRIAVRQWGHIQDTHVATDFLNGVARKASNAF